MLALACFLRVPIPVPLHAPVLVGRARVLLLSCCLFSLFVCLVACLLGCLVAWLLG